MEKTYPGLLLIENILLKQVLFARLRPEFVKQCLEMLMDRQIFMRAKF